MKVGRAEVMTPPSGTVADMLDVKGKVVHTAAPAATVYEAIERMAHERVGALLVVDDGKLVGIITERDYTHKVVLLGRSSHDTRVDEIMTTPVVTVPPGTSLDECLNLVTEKATRYLAVVDAAGAVVGLLSMGDLVRAVLEQQERTIRSLNAYIGGGYSPH